MATSQETVGRWNLDFEPLQLKASFADKGASYKGILKYWGFFSPPSFGQGDGSMELAQQSGSSGPSWGAGVTGKQSARGDSDDHRRFGG